MAVYTITDYIIALVLLFIILYLLPRYLFKRIALDEHLFIALAPIILLTISIRVLVDAGMYPKSQFWSVTPGIYLLGLLVGLVAISMGIFIGERLGKEYWTVSFAISAPFALYFFVKFASHMAFPIRFFYPLALALSVTALVHFLSPSVRGLDFLKTKSNISIIFAHMLDASGTFVGVDYYGFFEEHPLPEFIINLAGTAAIMIPLKLLVVSLALYYLEKSAKPEDDLYYKMLKSVFFVLGICPGTRNALILTLS